MGNVLLNVLQSVKDLEKLFKYKQRRIEVLRRKLEEFRMVGGVVVLEVDESSKEKMDLGHAKVVNVVVALWMRNLLSRWIYRERHVVRDSVSGAGGNRKVIIQPNWSVLLPNGRLKGENFRVL